jgi:hypothetical protein
MATSTQSLPPPAQSVPSSAQRSSLSPRGQEPQDSHPSRAIVVIAKSTPLLPSIKDRHLRPTATSNPFLRLSLPSPPAAPDAAALSVFPTALHPRCSVRACEAKLKDHRRRFFFVTVGRLERPPANSTAANLDTRAVFFRRLYECKRRNWAALSFSRYPHVRPVRGYRRTASTPLVGRLPAAHPPGRRFAKLVVVLCSL